MLTVLANAAIALRDLNGEDFVMANARSSALLALLGLSMSILGCVADADGSVDAENDTADEDAAGSNLLKHGDFEGVKDGWPAPSWKVVIAGKEDSDAAFVDKDSGYKSARGLRVLDSSDAGERITVSQTVPAKPMATYHLTARTRRVAAEHVAQHNDGSSQRLVLEFLDADKKLLTKPNCVSIAKYCHASYTVDPPMSTTKWARPSIGTADLGVEAPAGTHYVRVSIKANGTQGEYRDWDNIILNQVGWAEGT